MLLSGSCGELFKIYCSQEDSSLASNLIVGQTYYIRVYTFDSILANSARFNICIKTPTTSSSNDECNNSIPIAVNESTNCIFKTNGVISGATASSQPVGANPTTNPCFGSANDDVWFSFIANSETAVISLLNIEGTTSNLNHAIYSGLCDNLERLNCSNSNSLFSLTSNLLIGNT